MQLAELGNEIRFFDKIDFEILVSKLAMTKVFKLYFEENYQKYSYTEIKAYHSSESEDCSLIIDNDVARVKDGASAELD